MQFYDFCNFYFLIKLKVRMKTSCISKLTHTSLALRLRCTPKSRVGFHVAKQKNKLVVLVFATLSLLCQGGSPKRNAQGLSLHLAKCSSNHSQVIPRPLARRITCEASSKILLKVNNKPSSYTLGRHSHMGDTLNSV